MRHITRNQIQLAYALIRHILDNSTSRTAGAQHSDTLCTHINIIIFQHSAKAEVISIIAFSTIFAKLNRVHRADSLCLTRNAVEQRHNVQLVRNRHVAACAILAQKLHACGQLLLRRFPQAIVTLYTGIFKEQLMNLR